MKCIIPCCGYGTRLGMKPNESKEMLEDNIFGFDHIIDYALRKCSDNHLEPLVITRPEKTDLIEYIESRQINYILHSPAPGEEWNKTVLASKDYWQETNILMLPDTRWQGLNFKDMKNGLSVGNNAVMALHEVPNPSKWGVVKDYILMEKPKDLADKQWAWGLIAFKNTYGQRLFNNVEYLELQRVGFTYLDYFEDITREKK